MTRQAESRLSLLRGERIGLSVRQGDGVAVAGEAVRRALHRRGPRPAVLGGRELLGDVAVTFAARFGQAAFVELRARDRRRHDVVPAVTVLAGDVGLPAGGDRARELRVERVLE